MAQFTNQAQLSYRNRVVDSNVAVGEILAGLEVTKTAVTEEYTGGDTLTYAVSIINNSSSELTGGTLTDDLGSFEFQGETVYPLQYVEGSATLFLNGVLQSAPVPDTVAPLAFSGGALPAGGNYLLIYQADVTRFAPLEQGGAIVNTVTVDSDQVSAPVTAQETVTVAAAPNLTIQKGIDPVPVSENGRITYTLTVQNYGNTATTAEDNVIVTDTFDPILTDLAVTFNGEIWTEGVQYTYNETTGAFATVEDQVTVPAAAFTRDPVTGVVGIAPGTATLVITGTV